MILANLIKAYGFGRLQDLLTLDMELSQAGYSMDDLTEFVETKRRLLKKKERIRTITRNCACGTPMDLLPVNTGPRDQTGDDSTFVWMCSKCGECEYKNKTLAQIIKEA